MEPEVSIETARMIRVAVVAVGNIPTAQVRDYVSLVEQHQRVELKTVASYYEELQKSPFMREPWETGSMWFKFLVGGAPKSPWEDFQANRKCLGVIGILHCPSSSDLGAAYEHFLAICRAYPSAQVKRCFAFYPQEDQVEEFDLEKRQQLMFFPGSRHLLEEHLQSVMQEFAACLLMAFESWVLHADPVASILTTPLDSQVALNSEEVSKAKKRRLGRVQKTMGDYCLLAGSAADATDHYATAIELAKPTGDVFWLAGAIEGIMCALLVDHAGHRDQQLEEEVMKSYKEVIQLYQRERALSFELEATLKLARFLCRKELSREVVVLLMGAVDGSRGLMDASDKLVLNVEVARIFGVLGYERKAAFYMRQVAQLYQQQDSCWAAMSALQVLALTSKTYRVQRNENPLLESPQEGGHEQQSAMMGHRDYNRTMSKSSAAAFGGDGQWSTLQMDILGDMLNSAVRAGDPLSAWSAAARLLRHYYPLITPHAQVGLATNLNTAAECLPAGTRCSDPALPFLRLLSVTMLPLEMATVKRVPGKKEWWVEDSSSGPFIYKPSSSKATELDSKVIWVVGEPVQVLVELSNPCAFDVSVKSVSLLVESGNFESFPVSVVLTSNSSQVLSLSGLPLSVGQLVVTGCIVECFGVVTQHLFQDVEDLLSAVVLSNPFRSAVGHKGGQIQPADIEVMPPLPLLVAQVVGGDGTVVLYEGELLEMQVRLANAGVVPVVEATISLTGKQKEHILSLGHEVLEAALPLLPGASVVVPVQLKAGQPTMEVKAVGPKGDAAVTAKDPAPPMMVIYYAGPPMQATDDQGPSELPPGRRLALPLKVQVLRGLKLVQARLLSMEVPAHISRSLSGLNINDDSKKDEASSMLVKIDPYRGSWGLLLLELELSNATDVLFEITVNVKKEKELEETTGAVVDLLGNDCWYPSSRIDQGHSARIMVPLERFKLPGIDKSSLARKGLNGGSSRGKGSNLREVSDRQANAELNATIEELSLRISVKWHSGRNSIGELPIKEAIREALQASAIEILLPDPLTFGFRLARDIQLSLASTSSQDTKPDDEKARDTNGSLRNGGDYVVATDLTPIQMLVRNNTRDAMSLSLSVTCRDVTGASCLGSSGAEATVLWAGCMNGVDVEVPALGEVVHAFALCFLVPGQYTLLGAALLMDPQKKGFGPVSKLSILEVGDEPICFSGPPFTVDIIGTS